jgi:hypothetical protein
MAGYEVGDLDLLGNRVPASNGGIARAESRVINTLTLGRVVGIETVASEPVITPAGLSLLAVCTVATALPGNIGTVESSCLEAVFSSLLLGISWEVPRGQEFVNKTLVLADAVAEHPAMVSVMINTPLHIDHIASFVGCNRCTSPVRAWLVVVNADTGIVTARTTPADLCGSKIWPRTDRLEDSAFGARI